jgi:hypothetical protein
MYVVFLMTGVLPSFIFTHFKKATAYVLIANQNHTFLCPNLTFGLLIGLIFARHFEVTKQR